ncbi:hypothetical protein JHD48_03460 [Sulfurimonas sp. SAG-AH-194-I05]|nr:hypothetical protein [Sulfurimonas sp. SAG-AH-194-I05]MDF1874792.1 hypothetical protein [Sulfurimonas sp. SAG-AH-194-I05]
MKKIICIGNRFVYPDGAALWVYDAVKKETSRKSDMWIEGGLGGLNLITHFEDTSDILLLDYIKEEKNASFFSLQTVLENTNSKEYTHDSAFYYLLHSLETLLPSQPNITFLACNPDKEGFIKEVIEHVNIWRGL